MAFIVTEMAPYFTVPTVLADGSVDNDFSYSGSETTGVAKPRSSDHAKK